MYGKIEKRLFFLEVLFMKMTFRWYGESDCIPLSYISQIQCISGVVTAIYDVPVGEIWPIEALKKQKDMCIRAGLEMEVIESIPVHEDIKLGLSTRDKYIEVYKTNLRHCAESGVKCVCYNFMPVFDWLRTNLRFEHANGAYSLSYSQAEFELLDPKNIRLPGWDESYRPDELRSLLDAYKTVSRQQLFDNLVYFLQALMPVCNKYDINLAIHPDDPPHDIFGIPRIVSSEDDIKRIFEAIDDPHNGLTLCTGSLGAGKQNNVVRIAEKYAKRIHFAHLRQLTFVNETDFFENGHLTQCGSIDIFGVVNALCKNGFCGYVRPDHGRNVWGEDAKPGYGLYDRAMGACYLQGLFEASEKLASEEYI